MRQAHVALRAALIVILLACLIEAAARLSHVADVPLYEANNAIGYIPAPNQHGAFLRTHGWAFNELSMGTDRPFVAAGKGDVLLLGDSVVLGGNPFRQEERLGPRVARAMGKAVWPVSAGGWALSNELEYLREHPDVARRVGRIIIVSDLDDFAGPAYWQSELTHPRRHHWSHALYALDRYLLKWTRPAPDPAAAVRPRDTPSDFAALLGSGKPVTVILYPNKAQFAGNHACTFPPRWFVKAAAPHLFCVGSDPRWNAPFYMDEIHPTPAGTAVLARIIADFERARGGA